MRTVCLLFTNGCEIGGCTVYDLARVSCSAVLPFFRSWVDMILVIAYRNEDGGCQFQIEFSR